MGILVFSLSFIGLVLYAIIIQPVGEVGIFIGVLLLIGMLVTIFIDREW